MARQPGAEAIYRVADLFRERCLVNGRSLLWPDHHSWTVENLDRFHAAFIGNPDLSNKSFFEKWQLQLADQPDDVVRIAADLMVVYMLFPSPGSIGQVAKMGAVQAVLDWRLAELALGEAERDMLNAAFAHGIGKVGTHYHTGRPWQIQFYLEFSQRLLRDGIDPFDHMACKALADKTRGSMGKKVQARHILLHLLFPEHFEGTASDDHKKRIVQAFQKEAGNATDIDDALLAIRMALAERLQRPDLSFYQPEIRSLWDSPSANPPVTKTGNQTPPRREDSDAIRALIERLYPDESVRRACLEQLVESIRTSHAIHRGSWGTTLRGGEIRLNVGRMEALVLQGGDRILAMVDREAASDDEWTTLQNDPELRFKWEGRPFKVIPTAYGIFVPTSRFEALLPLIQPLHLALVRRAAEMVKTRTTYHQTHSPGVLAYLREELATDIPDPQYGEFGHQQRFWKISPGENANRWSEFQSGSYIAVNWIGTPDLAMFGADSSDELRAELQELSELKAHGFDLTYASKQLWSFLDEMAPGDLVCAYGNSRVLGWGTIKEDYEYREDVQDYPHRRIVDWQSTDELPATSLSPTLKSKIQRNVTIIELTEEEFAEIRGERRGGDTPPTLDDVAAVTYLDRVQLDELVGLLEEKRQIVLEGPPGSGKTWVAGKLARYLTGNPLEGETDERIELVQFHQSYGYEDFVQGIRPVTDENGQLQYRVLPGIFTRLCTLAQRNPGKRFVLVIDEINRGNISRIFGELLLLLEYRDQRVRLPYGAGDGTSDEAYLSIPTNLFLIGTMNSTDRSLALIDYALRRRFYFYRLLPMADGRASVFERWLADRSFAAEDRTRLLRLFVALNERIQELLSPDFQVGHSYFMTDDIATASGLDRVWRRGVLPLLEEYFHNSRDRATVLDRFALAALLATREEDFGDDAFADDDA